MKLAGLQNFNSSMVQLKAEIPSAPPSGLSDFNSSMVQLKGLIAPL